MSHRSPYDRKQTVGAEGCGKGSNCQIGTELRFGEDEKVLGWDGGEGCQQYECI